MRSLHFHFLTGAIISCGVGQRPAPTADMSATEPLGKDGTEEYGTGGAALGGSGADLAFPPEPMKNPEAFLRGAADGYSAIEV